MRRFSLKVAFVALSLFVMAGFAASDGANGQAREEYDWLPAVRLEQVVSGLDQPLFVTFAPGDRESLFIVEKTGRIRRFAGGALLPNLSWIFAVRFRAATSRGSCPSRFTRA